MNNKKLLRFIKESKTLLENATPEQKIKFLKLLRESYKKLKEKESVSNYDYLPEK